MASKEEIIVSAEKAWNLMKSRVSSEKLWKIAKVNKGLLRTWALEELEKRNKNGGKT